jgi:threonyl-tRNA synthetase
MDSVYGRFGFDYSLELSTRPEKYLGELSLWDKAEKQLEEVLNEFKASKGKAWKMNPGDGAFYGPKIDIHIKDALGRSHQCATVQLDFQLPLRFKLQFMGEKSDDLSTPVIIHRAILGSVERFMANLIEHTGGKWPFWISPRQIIVCAISDKVHGYAEDVRKTFHDAGYFVDVELSDKTIDRKIREAQLAQYNYILVVGAKEQDEKSVNVRTRDNQVHGTKKLADVLQEMAQLVKEFK